MDRQDTNDIRLAMKMAVLAYHSEKSCRSTYFSGWMDGQALVHETPSHQLVVSFRGTEGLNDLAINLMLFQSIFTHVPNSRVHTGFMKQYNALRGPMMAHLLPKLYQEQNHHTIMVVGHSLGGALATLCAADLAHRHPNLHVRSYVFGSPRVGDRGFVQEVQRLTNLNIIRIYNKYDLVPCLPWFGFTHTPSQICVSAGNTRWYQVLKRHSIQHMYHTFVTSANVPGLGSGVGETKNTLAYSEKCRL
jgi:hypothetical protein